MGHHIYFSKLLTFTIISAIPIFSLDLVYYGYVVVKVIQPEIQAIQDLNDEIEKHLKGTYPFWIFLCLSNLLCT